MLQTQFMTKVILLGLISGTILLAVNAQAEDLLTEDLLADDDWTIELDKTPPSGIDLGTDSYLDNNEPESVLSIWLNPLSTQLSYTQDIDDEAHSHLKRSSVKFNYDKYLNQGLYVSFNWKLTHFLKGDQQAFNQNMMPKAATHTKWQQAWLQYSQGKCVGKLGKQSLVWGQVDGTFAVDVINPFDLTEPLLTDFSDVKRGQNIVRLDCYDNKSSWQLFYSPKASFNRLDFNTEFESLVSQKAEVGVRYSMASPYGDFAVMAARLQANQPVPTLTGLRAAEYELLAISGAIPADGFLIKADIAYKTKQAYQSVQTVSINPMLFESTDDDNVLEVAGGLEYSTQNNHQYSLGLWSSFHQRSSSQKKSDPVASASWNKAYLNDDLMLSALANYNPHQKFKSVTVLAQYKLDDYWQLEGALSSATQDMTLSPTNTNVDTRATTNTLNMNVKVQF